MDSINSFKGYGKVTEEEDRAFRKKSRKRLIIIGVSVIVLVAITVGAVVGVSMNKKDNNNSTQNPSSTSSAESIKAVCSLTQHRDSCYSSIASINAANTTDPEELFKLSLQVAINEVKKILSLPDTIKAKVNDTKTKAALTDCGDLFDASIDQLNASLSSMQVSKGEKLLTKSKIEDLKTWLSAAITNQETCLDGLEEISVAVKNELEVATRNATEFSSNSLGIVAGIFGILEQLDIPIHRKLLGFDQFPDWVSPSDRRLLQVNTPPDAVVAKDGSGNFTTIQKAVDASPKKSLKRYMIYVKSGRYIEQVTVDKSKWNLMVIGDGQSKTIVSGSKNFVDGTPTFSTATFIAVGRGFIAKDIGIENTAGPEKHQAVAFRSGSDRSVFYRCSFDGYQDTLYAHSLRQFYRECEISGTVDFIFGNAASVLQNCNIRPREPLPNQQNTITAQGKTDPEQNTGISIHGCQISAFSKNLTAKTYLGRPWKPYSTTVVMKTGIDGIVDPAGWLQWTSGVLPPKTIFYGEYQNTGPGSSVVKRVDWPGYKSEISDEEAGKYAVDSFIQGSEWLPETGVLFAASL